MTDVGNNDGLLISLFFIKQFWILFAANKTGFGIESLAESITVTSEVIRYKVTVHIAAEAEDAVAHPVPTLLDLGDHKHSGVDDGSLAPALGPGLDNTKLCQHQGQGQGDKKHNGVLRLCLSMKLSHRSAVILFPCYDSI